MCAHYYRPDDSTLFECDLRVAKKQSLYPSVTGILGMQDKPGLIYYFKQQAALSALTMPRKDGESDEDFVKRIIVDSDEDKNKAADIGSLVHYWIEHYLKYKSEPNNEGDGRVFNIFQSVKKWLDDNIKEVICTEKTYVTDDYEYGCKIDLLARGINDELILIDFKTQKIKPDDKGRQKPTYYLDSYCSQLTAQHNAMFPEINVNDKVQLMSVVVSSIPSDKGDYPVFEHEWDEEEKRKGWEIFKACRILHKIKKGI